MWGRPFWEVKKHLDVSPNSKSDGWPLISEDSKMLTGEKDGSVQPILPYSSLKTGTGYNQAKKKCELWAQFNIYKESISEHLTSSNESKFYGLVKCHARVEKEFPDTVPLSVISHKLWKTGEMPQDWKEANAVLIVRKEDPGNYRLSSLLLVLDILYWAGSWLTWAVRLFPPLKI